MRHICSCISDKCLFTFWGSLRKSPRRRLARLSKNNAPALKCTVSFKQQHPGYLWLDAPRHVSYPTLKHRGQSNLPRWTSSTPLPPLPASGLPCFGPAVSACLRAASPVEDVPGQRTARCNRSRPLDRAERSRELDAVKDVLPNNSTAAMARLVPLLFVQKCHGRAETAHVTVKRGRAKTAQMWAKVLLVWSNHAPYLQTSQTRHHQRFKLCICCVQ